MQGEAITFRVLGPIEIDEGSVAVPTGRRRRLFSTFLTRPNENLSSEWLLDDLWDGLPPPTARTALHVHVSHLRKLLDLTVARVPLVTTASSYRLEAGPEEIDWLRFEDEIRLGREVLTTGDRSGAFDHFDCALVLWRGDPFDGAGDPTDIVGRLAARLTESRRATLVAWADLAIRRVDVDPVPVLTDATQCFPYDEDLSVRLATALAVSGRQPDALAELRRCGDVLREDLGLSAQPVLGDLERSVLEQEDDLVERFVPDRAVAAMTDSSRKRVLAGRPPSASQPCVGRDDLLARLVSSNGPPVVWLVGPGGRGKTRFLGALGERNEVTAVRYAAATREPAGPVPVLRSLFPERADVSECLTALARGSPGPVEVGVAVAEALLSSPPAAEEWWLIDDAQWLRGDERAALRRLAVPITEGEVAARLVVAGRERPPDTGAFAGDWAVMDLAPLTDEAIATILGETHVPALLAEIVRGEPLLATQLATAADAAGGLSQLGDPAGILQQAADSLVRTISRDAGHVVDVLAVAGTTVTRMTLDRALDWPASRLDAALVSAEQAGLVAVATDSIDIAHQTLRDPLLIRVEPPIRQRWALALSRASQVAGSSMLSAGLRASVDGSRPDAQGAVRALLHAGREALRSLALGEASRIGALGVELAVPASREAAEARLIEALGTTDEPGADRTALLVDAWERSLILGAEDVLTEAAIALSGPWSPGNRVDHDVTERLRRTAERVADPGLRARLLARLVTFRLGMLDDAIELADQAWQAAQSSGDPEAVCLAASAQCYAALGQPGTSTRRAKASAALSLAERSSFYERVPSLATQLFIAASALGYADDQGRALAAYEAVIEVTGRPVDRWHRCLLGATEAMSRGALDEAEALSAEAAVLGARAQLEDAFADRVVQQFCLALLADDRSSLRPLAPSSDDRPLAVASRLVAAVARGDEAEIESQRHRMLAALGRPRPDYLWVGALYLSAWAGAELLDDLLIATTAGAAGGFGGERAVVGTGLAVLGALPGAVEPSRARQIEQASDP